MDERLLNKSKELWNWFLANASAVASQLELESGDGLPPALERLDSLVAALGGDFSWEVGPLEEKLFLAISPGGDAVLFQQTKEIVALAEAPSGWALLPAKPPKDWNRSILFAGQHVDASHWLFRIRRLGDDGLGIILGIPGDTGLSSDDQESLGWLVLESELGEATVIERIVDVEVTTLSKWPDDAKGRPIHHLWTDVERGNVF